MKDNKRIVVKVGTSTLCHGGKGLNYKNIDQLAKTLTDIKNAGHEVILVTSGAIGAAAGNSISPNARQSCAYCRLSRPSARAS
jgi:glutamate 5-kinase